MADLHAQINCAELLSSCEEYFKNSRRVSGETLLEFSIWLLELSNLTHAELELPVKPALARLAEIHIPTLLLVGDADIPDVHAHAGGIEAGIPRVYRVVVNDVGHLMYIEKPAEFSRIVIGFLEKQ